MKILEMTDVLKEQTNFASQALFQIVQTQNLLVIHFNEVTGPEKEALVKLITQLDSQTQFLAHGIVALLSIRQLQQLIKIWSKFFPTDPTQLKKIYDQHKLIWQTGDFNYDLTTTGMIYAIMNNTPDSFYDGGRYQGEKALLNHVEEMLNAGADVIEVNGQTTRPGFTEVDAKVEIERTIPLIKSIKQRFPETNIAIDTYKYPVMEAALDAGASIINDVNAFTDDPKKLELMSHSNTGLLTMHSSRGHEYENLTAGVYEFLSNNLNDLQASGIAPERIAIDEGIGYSKVVHGQQDYTMIRNLDQFNLLKRPIMIAISRKGFFGNLLGLEKDDRLPMTLVTEAAMYLAGGRILRVHDVAETKQMLTLLDQIQDAYWINGLGNSNNY